MFKSIQDIEDQMKPAQKEVKHKTLRKALPKVIFWLIAAAIVFLFIKHFFL